MFYKFGATGSTDLFFQTWIGSPGVKPQSWDLSVVDQPQPGFSVTADHSKAGVYPLVI